MKKQGRVFQFGERPVEGFPPMPKLERTGPPLASLYDYRQLEYQAAVLREPPNGYGALICPQRAVVGRQFFVRATLAARPIDLGQPMQRAWWDKLTNRDRSLFPVEARIQSTKAFDFSSDALNAELGIVRRLTSLDFIAVPTIPGSHTIKVWLRYPGGPDDVSFEFLVKVRSRIVDLIQRVGIIVTVLAGVVGVATAIVAAIG